MMKTFFFNYEYFYIYPKYLKIIQSWQDLKPKKIILIKKLF